MLLNCSSEKDSSESLGQQEIKPVNPKRNQPWVFIGGTVAEAEAPILWLPELKCWLIGKDSDAGKDWGQKEKRDDRGWDASPTQWIWIWANCKIVEDRGDSHVSTRLQSWTQWLKNN